MLFESYQFGCFDMGTVCVENVKKKVGVRVRVRSLFIARRTCAALDMYKTHTQDTQKYVQTCMKSVTYLAVVSL